MWNFWTNIAVVYIWIIPSLTFVWKFIMSTTFITQQFTQFFYSNRSNFVFVFCCCCFFFGGVFIYTCRYHSAAFSLGTGLHGRAFINTAHAVVTSITAVELIESDCPQNELIHASLLWLLWSKMRIHTHPPLEKAVYFW